MKVTALKCPKCEDVIWSRHRHDFRRCLCKGSFIDGGPDYSRCGIPDDFDAPELSEIEIDDAEFKREMFRYYKGNRPVISVALEAEE